MSDTATRVITSHLPSVLADQVDEIALRMDRSKGWIVKQALAEFVAIEERRYQLIAEALAELDADESKGVPHSVVEAWIDTLGTDSPGPMPTC
jgi:predicted transcriptional regulator